MLTSSLPPITMGHVVTEYQQTAHPPGRARPAPHDPPPADDRRPLLERGLDLVVRHRREHLEVLVAGLAERRHRVRRVVPVIVNAHPAVKPGRRGQEQLQEKVHHAWSLRRGAGSVSLISAIEKAGSTRTNTRKNMKNQANEPTMSATSVIDMR